MNKDEKALELLKAMGDIKDEYVEEAALTESASDSPDNVVDFEKSSKKSYESKKWAGLAVAACLVLVVGFGVWKISDTGTKDTSNENIAAEGEAADDIAHYDVVNDSVFDDTEAAQEGAAEGEGSFKYSGNTRSGNSIGLTDDMKEKAIENTSLSEDEAKNLNASSLKLFNEVVKNEESGKNILISPTSILYAFGMLENGAKGDTLKQLEDAVNNGMDKDSLNKSLCSLRASLQSSEAVKWNIANSIWFKDDGELAVNKDFLSLVKDNYSAEVYKAPFDTSTLNDINLWVSENTDQMIPAVLDNISPEAVMYLINAMCFEGEWADQYEDYQVEEGAEFVNEDGSITPVNMLNGEEAGYFILGDGYGFKKNYAGGDYSFVGIEVSDEVSLDDYIKKLTLDPDLFRHTIDQSNLNYDSEVIVRMPEFTYDYDKELTEVLKGMGVNDVFDASKADLTGMFDNSNIGDYSVGKVLHKTHIELDRNGTRAAAVTAIETEGNAMVEERDIIEINLDHPFVYAIVDNKTNIPVFIGCVKKL